MRIVVVSAHFPPNFVSGGTLQPQRLAHRLRARGHDVSVYAGWLGDERAAGTTWTETDETGMDVRWIVTTPFTRWDDRNNFDNPLVTADFRSYLRTVEPDVVHLHSLQSLGAPLVPVAKEHGAAVIVTMHDFWWCCARQFLLDREGRPCSLVVDAGVCACEVDRSWLVARNAFVRPQLDAADLVLAPSTSAEAVLAANGVDRSRLVVDENGMERGSGSSSPTAPDATRDATVAFLYAGGGNVVKGVDVLMAACRQLAPAPNWRLEAYGVDGWHEQHRGLLDGLPVRAHSAYAPADAHEVFRAADVLVVPSLVRESYSLLTREALAHGLAVVTSDCLGPEEVVEDGVNGLVVPSGDPIALAEAMRRMTNDRELLARARASAPAVVLRSIDDQVEGLERRYEGLLAAGRAPAARTTEKRRTVGRVLFIAGIEGAPLRYRVRLPAEALGLLGVDSEVRWFTDPDLPNAIDRADVVVVYRVPATAWVLEALDHARRRSTPLLFDVDDLIFDPALADEIPALSAMTASDATLWLEGVHRYRTTMERCDGFIASTPALATHAGEVVGHTTFRFDNGVGLVLGRHSDRAVRRARAPGPARMGYLSGTDTHDRDWQMIEPAVARVMASHPDVEIWLGGHVPATRELSSFSTRVRRLPFQDWRRVPAVLRDLDVNLAPLEFGHRFNEAKSAIKWLEAALVETPTIASPTAPFRDAISHGRTGLLASTEDEWAAAIEELLADEAHRVVMGHRARRDALLRWSPHLQASRYLDILERVEPSTPRGEWTPVVGTEPLAQHPFEPYADAPVRPARWKSIVRRLVGR